MAGHVRSLLLLGKWQGNSAECPFSYQGPWSTSKQCSLSQTNDHRSACFAANAQSRVYLCVRSWNQSRRKCKSPCMNCTIGMLPPPSSVVAQSRGNGPGERQRLKSINEEKEQAGVKKTAKEKKLKKQIDPHAECRKWMHK